MAPAICTWCPQPATVDSGEGFLLCDECERLLKRRLAILNSNKQLEVSGRDTSEKPPGSGIATGPRRAGQESAATDSVPTSSSQVPTIATSLTADTEPSLAPVSAFSSIGSVDELISDLLGIESSATTLRVTAASLIQFASSSPFITASPVTSKA